MISPLVSAGSAQLSWVTVEDTTLKAKRPGSLGTGKEKQRVPITASQEPVDAQSSPDHGWVAVGDTQGWSPDPGGGCRGTDLLPRGGKEGVGSLTLLQRPAMDDV